MTRRLARRIVADARVMPIRQVARRHRIGWHKVNALVLGWSALVAARRRSRACRVLLVDETSMRKRHRYVAVIVNAQPGEGLGPSEISKRAGIDRNLGFGNDKAVFDSLTEGTLARLVKAKRVVRLKKGRYAPAGSMGGEPDAD